MTDRDDIAPLDRQAHIAVDVSDGYVRIEQSVGDPPLYTPGEAREIAAEIVEAADRAEST